MTVHDGGGLPCIQEERKEGWEEREEDAFLLEVGRKYGLGWD